MVVVQWLRLCSSTAGGRGFKSLAGDLKKKKINNFWSFSFYKENFDLKLMAMFFENKSGFRLLNLFFILR